MEPNEYRPSKVPSIEEIRDDENFQPYLKTLTKILGEILGWSRYRTKALVEERLQHPWFRSFFGHHTPCDDAASVIVRETLMQRLIACRISTCDIIKEIHHTLEGSRETYNTHPDTDPGYNWQQARDEIADIIKEWERKCDEVDS